jgi:XRE family aerobic/anaerobic benzoate catabolism transcriptional regulator
MDIRRAIRSKPSIDAQQDTASDTRTEIGKLVRHARAARGMTRKDLARRSATSERYLALIESGDGNPTVLVLDAIAKGLGVRLFDLLPLGKRDRAQLKAIERLKRLSVPQVEAVLRSLDVKEGAAAERARRVALIGLRGAGKSTLGAALAAQLDCPFVELDRLIEKEHGASTAALFEVYGQAAFRRYERECLTRVVAREKRVVIATAGGLVTEEETFERLLASTHVVWLRANPDEHMGRVMRQGDLRPMARNRDARNDLVAILKAREADYARAHAELDTSGKSVETALRDLAEIVEALFARG